eukprot:6926467-Ditylum_brightwellii.AAC.1
MMLASGSNSNGITTSGDSGSSKTSQVAEDKSTMKIFRVKGILSVQHTVNKKDGIVMLYGNNDEDAAFHNNYLDATLGLSSSKSKKEQDKNDAVVDPKT